MFKSRWGYHVVDHATYLKLKFINKCYWQAMHDEARWRRWDRKLPKNRVLRKWIRDAQGRKCGHEIVGPAPEPKVFRKLCGKQGQHWSNDFYRSRIPYDKADNARIQTLQHSSAEIEQMHQECESFFK